MRSNLFGVRTFARGLLVLGCVGFGSVLRAADAPLGLFAEHADVGVPSTVGPGSIQFDDQTKTYTVLGGGQNMWSTSDHFQYVYKKVSGDVSITANLEFVGTSPETGTPDPHRKACLVIRQSLDSDSAYADAAKHGDGLTSLQWRDAKGAVTHEVQCNVVGPKRLRLEKRGNYISMSIAEGESDLRPAGGAARIDLTGEFYIGLGVSAHHTGRIEKAAFSNIEITPLAPIAGKTTLINTLETISIQSKDRRVVHVVTQPTRLEAPNWVPDDTNTLLFNNNGKLYKVQAELPGVRTTSIRKPPEAVDLGSLNRINNDHGISPDGKWLAISDQSVTVGKSRPSIIYILPSTGGEPKRITGTEQSWFHGWAPDGKSIVYCAQRNKSYGIYSIPADGGAETCLITPAIGTKADGPEYSPEGQHIYFNSDRGGLMQIWRMKPDGSAAEQFSDERDSECWFPHISPNGLQMVFLTYEKGAGDHPENKEVALRLMDLKTKKTTVLAKLFGGQGTINVASWSPNSKYLAFVSYQVVPGSDAK